MFFLRFQTILGLLLMGLLFQSLFLFPAYSQESITPPLNQLILQCIKTMPTGGGYSAGGTANQGLHNAVQVTNGNLQVNATHAIPSYCSEATYLVFLKTIASLQSSGRDSLSPGIAESLRARGQPDGTGIWGRWNANGPGTARLFSELGLGHNFSDLAQAQRGDFLKIWWSDFIGASEHGHSVIFMGMENREGIPYLSYWSSNVPGGYGVKSVPMSRIHRMLFSRLENPSALNRVNSLPHSDHYLSSLQNHNSTAAEMNQLCDVR